MDLNKWKNLQLNYEWKQENHNDSSRKTRNNILNATRALTYIHIMSTGAINDHNLFTNEVNVLTRKEMTGVY